MPGRRQGTPPPSPHARLAALFLAESTRASIRVDTPDGRGGWRHAYREVPRPSAPPDRPWLVYLTSDRRHFELLCFDLDTKSSSPGGIHQDLTTLRRWLQQAGLAHVVAASGPGGGRHVWVRAAEPLQADVVRAIADEAAARLPSLDHSMLCNPATGGARPLGAPHRSGGHSRLLAPDDEDEAAARLRASSCGNRSFRFTRLLQVIAAEPVMNRTHGAASRALRGTEATRVVVEDGPGAPYLAGTPRTLLDPATRELLYTPPPPDQVSETQAKLLVRLAVRRWRWPMVERLLRDRAARTGGLLHAVTRVTAAGRKELTERQARAKLEREWRRCVAFAARLPEPEHPHRAWSDRIAAVTAAVTAIQETADACPHRWATQAGPADRAILDLLCLVALESGSLNLAMDMRRAALATGIGRSTASRAFERLRMDHWLDHGTPDGGPASVHHLITPQGGTQQHSPPDQHLRDRLITTLQRRLAIGAADVFAYGPTYLGHHAARIYQAIDEGSPPPVLPDLVERCGYSERTTTRHLHRMAELQLVTTSVHTIHHRCPHCQAPPGTPCDGATRRSRAHQHHSRQRAAAEALCYGTPRYRIRPRALAPAARRLRSNGKTKERAAAYAAEAAEWRARVGTGEGGARGRAGPPQHLPHRGAAHAGAGLRVGAGRSVGAVAQQVDPVALAAHLAIGQPDILADRSLFRDVHRVPPGSLLRIDGGAPAVERFEPAAYEAVPLAEAAPVLGATLRLAVAARLDGRRAVSSDLAGLDSTTLACLAAGHGPTVATTFTDPRIRDDDVAYARRTAAAVPGLRHRVVTGGVGTVYYSGLDDLDHLPATDAPNPYTVTAAIKRTVLAAATAERPGPGLHFTGTGGDTVLSATGYLPDLLRDRAYRTACAHAQARARVGRTSVWKVLRRARPAARTTFAGSLHLAAVQLRRPARTWDPDHRRPHIFTPLLASADWMTPQARHLLADALDHAADSVTATQAPGRLAAWTDRQDLLHLGADTNGWRAIAEGEYGTELAAPYLDNEVIRVCLAVPPEQRAAVGRYKPLLAAAFPTGPIPDFVLERVTKGGFNGVSYAGLRTHAATITALLGPASRLAALGLAGSAPVAAVLQRAAAGQRTPQGSLHLAVATEVWLRQLDTRPASWWEEVASRVAAA